MINGRLYFLGIQYIIIIHMYTQCIGLHAYHLCQVGFEGEQHFKNIQASLFHSHMDCSLTLHRHIHLYIENSSRESDKSAAVHVYLHVHSHSKPGVGSCRGRPAR